MCKIAFIGASVARDRRFGPSDACPSAGVLRLAARPHQPLVALHLIAKRAPSPLASQRFVVLAITNDPLLVVGGLKENLAAGLVVESGYDRPNVDTSDIRDGSPAAPGPHGRYFSLRLESLSCSHSTTRSVS